MWQVHASSRVAALRALQLVCAVAVTSTHMTGSAAFQQQQQQQHSQNSHPCPLSSPSMRLHPHCRVACDNSNDSTSLYPSRTSRISVLHGSRQPSSETLPTEDPSSWLQDHYVPMAMPTRGQLAGHAIFGTLHGETMIEQYQIWKRRNADDSGASDNTSDDNNKDVVIGLVTFGSHLNGHPSLVHGGILSLIFDDICGFAYEAVGVKHAVTANLTVDYRAPVPAGSQVRVGVQLETREGRKLFWKAQMTSVDGKTLYAEASSLYIIPRSAVQS